MFKLNISVVCIYICVFVRAFLNRCVFLRVYVYMCIVYVYMYVCMCVCVCCNCQIQLTLLGDSVHRIERNLNLGQVFTWQTAHSVL